MVDTCPKQVLVCLDIYKPPHCPRVLVVSKEGYCKKFVPGVCPLNYKLYKSPPMPGWGVVGLDIDRCITVLGAQLYQKEACVTVISMN